MDTVTLAHAKEHLEELIARASNGEDVRITDAKGMAVRLMPADKSPSRVVFGQWSHLGDISKDRLLAPLNEDETAWLSGEAVAVK